MSEQIQSARRRIQRMIARAGIASSNERISHSGAEQLESRVMLAVISPGNNGIASQAFSTLNVAGSDEVIIDINPSAPAGSQNDVVDVAGATSLSGVLTLRLSNASSLTRGQSFEIVRSGSNLLNGAFLSIKGIDATGSVYDFVAIQSAAGLRVVATDLPSTSLTIIPGGTASETITRADNAVAFYAAGSSDDLDDTLSFPGTLSTYGQKLIGGLTFTEGGTVAAPEVSISVGNSGTGSGRMVFTANVTTAPLDVFTTFGTANITVASPGAGQAAEASLSSFSVTGFALADQDTPSSLLSGSGKIGPVSFTAFTLEVNDLVISDDNIQASITLGAAEAALALGGNTATNSGDFFKISATELSVTVGIDLALSGSSITANPGSGKVSITADTFTMEIQDIITVEASGIEINSYDEALDPSQTLVSIEEASVEVPKLGLKGEFTSSAANPGLVIRGDGFTFGTLTVTLDTESGGGGADPQGYLSTAGGRLKVKNPKVFLTDFSMSFDTAGAITQTVIGSFGVGADELVVSPFAGPAADRFNAVASGLEVELQFADGITIVPGQPVTGSPTGVRISVSSVEITLGFVKLTGNDIELNTAAAADEYFLIVQGNIAASLDLADFFSSQGGSGPNIQITGSAGGFAVKGDGTFEPFTTSSDAPYNENPFHVRLVVASGQVNDVLEGVADLPDSLPKSGPSGGSLDLSVTWPDFNADPSRFLMRITGDIAGSVGGASGLTLAFRVTDLQIDSEKLANGEFPIVGLQSVSGSVSGMIMGSQFNGLIVLGLVRFDAVGAVLDSNASVDDVAATRLYVGARGGITLPNGWGVNVQFAFSEKGFLNFYLSSNLDIPLGTSGLSLTGLRGGVTFNATPLPSIDDPYDLRNSAFKAPDDLTNEEWEDQVRQLVINQYGGTPGFVFEIDQPSGQDWTLLFDDNADPGLYLPEEMRTEFLGAGIAIPRKAGVSTMQTLIDGEQWLLLNGDDAFIIEFDSGTNKYSVSQVTMVLPSEIIDALPTTSSTAGAVSALIDGENKNLVDLFGATGRRLSSSATVVYNSTSDDWTITDGGVIYTLTVRGDPGNEIVAVTGGDPTFESGSGMTIRLDAGFSLSSTGGSTAWRLKADAIIQFVVGGPANTKIVLLGDLSVGPEANPGLSVDTRLLIDLSQSGSVTMLMLADFRVAPAASSPADPNPDVKAPFFSLYGRVQFSFVNGTFSFSITGSQTRGVAVFDTAGFIDSPLGNQKLLLGAPSSPAAMDGAGSASVTFNGSKLRFTFAAALSAQGLINASNAVSASGDLTVEFANVNVGSLGNIKLPTALYGAARLNASLDQIQILQAAGITGNINLLLKINTTSVAQTALLYDPVGMTDEPLSIAPRSFALFGDGNLAFKPPVVGAAYHMQITGAFGIDISAGGGANLFIVGTMPVPMPGLLLRGMTADVVGLLRIDGSNFAARLELAIHNNPGDIKFFSIGAELQLYINTAGTPVSYTMPRDIAGRLGTTLPPSLANRLIWSDTGDAMITVPERAPLITYSTDGAMSPTPGGYLVIQGFGGVDILDPISRTTFLHVDASARIALQVDASDSSNIKTQFQFQLNGNASIGGLINLNIGADVLIATTYDFSQPIPRLASVNMVADLALSASANLGLVRMQGSGNVHIDTFTNSVSVSVSGDLYVGEVFKLHGDFSFENNAQRVAITGNVKLDLYIAQVDVTFNAAIYKSIMVNGVETNDPGLVLNIGVSLNVDFLKVFVINGDGRLRVSTRAGNTNFPSAPVGFRDVPGRINASTPFINIHIGASLNFLNLVTVNGDLDFSTVNDTAWQPGWSPSVKRHWKIEGSLAAAAGISFLGGAEARIGNARQLDGNLSGRKAVFYDTGEFDVDASLRVQVGPNEFNVNGRGYAFASYLRNGSGVKVLSFGGGAALGISVDVDLGEVDFGPFGTLDLGSITFSFDAVSVSFNYNGNTGEVTIRPSVMGISKTFSLGFFKLPAGAGVAQRPVVINLAGPELYTARTAADGPEGIYDETTAWNGGVLYINAGSRAQYRNLSNDVIDEDYIIEADGPYNSATGQQNVKITAFGQTQTRSNVTSIRALMGSGIDNVIVRPGVLVPVTIDGGIGNDKITYSSTGVATITGGDGNDRISAAGATGTTIDGGNDNDVITWLSGNGANVTVTGGLGNDQFIAAFSDLADRVRLNRTSMSEQFRLSKLNSGGTPIEYVSVTGGIESLRVNSLRGADELFIDDFDAGGMSVYFDVSRYQSGTTTVPSPNGGQGTGQAPVYSNDTDADTITLSGGAAADFFVLTSPADGPDQDGDSNTTEAVLTVARSNSSSNIYTVRILNAVAGTGERVLVNGLGGDDVFDAKFVTSNLARLSLIGNGGNDTLHGSNFADTLVGDEEDGSGTGNDRIYGYDGADSIIAGGGNDIIDAGDGDDSIDAGLGDDTVTGGAGNDSYFDAGGADTFIEVRNRDMFISDNAFVVGVMDPGSVGGFGDAFSGVDENENLKGIFNVVRLTGGAAANTIVVGDVSGTIAVPGNANQSVAQQFTGHAILDGLDGGDRYIITVFGTSRSVFDVLDTGAAGSGSDLLRIYGADVANRTDTFLVRKNFVAALFDLDNSGSLEVFDRVNYNTALEGGLTIRGLNGNDRFIVDETSIATVIEGGEGADYFQFGQIFATDRVPTAVSVGDEISTVRILLGIPTGGTVEARLSAGPSTSFTALGGEGDDSFFVLRTISPLSLQGEGGNDTFTVRAFEQVGSGGTTQGNTTVTGGAGADAIEFVANAPITIEGGEGIDTVRLLGTFRDDQFIVDSTGITGPGLNIFFSTVETLEINSGDGNDEIFVRSTSANLRVVVFAGAGSDRMYVGQVVPGGAATPKSLSGVRGPVLLDGGPGAPEVFGLSKTIILPTETDGTLPPGAGNMLDHELATDVDTVDIISTDDTANLAGLMSARTWPNGSSSFSVITLSGLGMGGDLVQENETVPGGISMRRLEVVDAQLGSGVETIGVSAVLASAITIFRANGGSDVFNVSAPATTGAMLVIYGDARPGETFTGVAGDDRVDGRTAGVNMTLDGGIGNDTLLAGSGADRIGGGSGDDVIAGGAGNDLILGDSRLIVDRLTRISTIITSGLSDSDQAGKDTINPGAGFNIVFGDHGTVTPVNGTSGIFAENAVFGSANTVRPTIGNDDTISAFASANAAFTGLPAVADGEDLIFGGAGKDRIDSGDGRDWIIGDHGSAQIGEPAPQPVSGSGGVLTGDATLTNTLGSDIYYTPETARQTAARLLRTSTFTSITPVSFPVVLRSAPGTLIALTSTDPTNGDADVINSGSGDDVVIGGTASDIIDAGADNDVIFGDHGRFDPFASIEQRFVSTFFAVIGAGGDDRILAGDGDDIAMGQQGTDFILGQAGNDDVIGGHNVAGGLDGVDNLDGGSGDDAIIGDNGSIVRDPNARSPRFVSPAGAGGSMYDANFDVAITSPAPLGTAAPIARTIRILDASPTTSIGMFGADRIAGGAGNDIILAGNGDDQVRGDGQIIDGATPSLAASASSTTDSDDYIEGNSGADTIWGDLGQDDIVGGGSSLFGLASTDRTDGSDTIYGGNGTQAVHGSTGDTSATGEARDADTIAGDNADIFRLVGATGDSLTFVYDAGASPRILPRVVRLLDYTADGLATGDTGAADTIHGESGNDTVYGMTGNDALFGDGQNDDLIGGSGDDWIYGGTGNDGVLGDDGRLLTAKNGTAEPLNGIAATTQQLANTNDQIFTQTIFATGTITKYARFQAFENGGADVIFGGLGNDFLHGGAGMDAISGAEALAAFAVPPANKPVLSFNNGLRRFTLFNPGFGLNKIANFFLNFDAGPLGNTIDDGADMLFGDNGHDWLVGGTNADRLFGGMGDDVLNADDQLDTNGGSNNIPDVGAESSPDIVFGGGGLDRLIANATTDRLIDWNGEFNQYLMPFTGTYPTVIKASSDILANALRLLGAGSGMDTRLVEPAGELGLVMSTDPQWVDQIGRPYTITTGSSNDGVMPVEDEFGGVDFGSLLPAKSDGIAASFGSKSTTAAKTTASPVVVASVTTLATSTVSTTKAKAKTSMVVPVILTDLSANMMLGQEYAQ
jgi:Ca2+-binding RTX toxin-like protein